MPRYPTRAKYSCIDFWDPKSGILGLFGFLLPNFSTKMVFFYAFWRAAVKNQNKTIQLDFHQVGSYLVECGTVTMETIYFRKSLVTLVEKKNKKGWILSIITWKIAKMDHLWLVNSHIYYHQRKVCIASSNIINVFLQQLTFYYDV